jgi:FtsH-binding integral membrane protein
MSMGYDLRIAARAPASERAAFIRRTYGHLAGAILAFAILETLLLQLPGIENLVAGMFRAGFWIVLIAFLGVSFLARYWAQASPSLGMQYLGLGLYVVAEAIIFLPLLYIAKTYYHDAIATAGILTLCMFVGLTAVVFFTRSDYSYLGPILSIAAVLMFGLALCAFLFGFHLGLLFCFAGVALACGFILYDTSNVLHKFRTDMHVAAALELFASIAILFYYIIMILMSRNGRS